jgi:C4-dicarboxylate transporter, DctM subunit
MSGEMVGFLGFGGLFLLMAIGVPIGIAFLTVGFLGITFLTSMDTAIATITRIPYTWSSDYIFSSIPLFVLMGLACSQSGLAADLFRSAYSFLGRLPGGLAQATIAASAGFGAVSGSSTAGAATMSSICYKEMTKFKYSPELAAGTVSAGGTISILIPPSLGFIIYGILAEQSIGKLFLAGLIPGIIQTLLYCITLYFWAKIRPLDAPSSQGTSLAEKLSSLKGVWPIIVLFLFILGGIYFGIFTAIEAGAFGAFAAILIAFIMGRSSVKMVVENLITAARLTAMMFMLLMGAMVFNVFLGITKLPQFLSILISQVNSPTLMVLLILALYFPLGCFMDTTSMFLLTVPLFLPALKSGGVDLIWFGVLVVISAEIALITPPVGMNVYVVQGMIKEISLERVFKGVMPFVLATIILLLIIFLFPYLALFLPNLMN